jgi:hypothetical protein
MPSVTHARTAANWSKVRREPSVGLLSMTQHPARTAPDRKAHMPFGAMPPTVSSTDPMPPTRDSAVGELIAFALDSLPAMQLPSGLFAWERRAGEAAPRGHSLRYTLMVLLGVHRARAEGYDVPLDVERIEAALMAELGSPELAPGDFGLHLWLDERAAHGQGEELVDGLERSLDVSGGLSARVGMELGWIVSGLARHVAAGGEDARPLLQAALDQLLGSNRAPSGLFRHGGEGRRRRFPNFATQIYSVLALAQVGAAGLDERALPAARAAADKLLELQLPDGGWPWVFDAETGRVVERYEVYSVHQDAMAPMGMFALTEATGEPRYAAAALAGLNWIFGANELGVNMIELGEHIVDRSIRRRRPWSKARLYGNTAAALVTGRAPSGPAARFMLERNRTDRPYHFGWVLEAWCGRERGPAMGS